MAHPNKRGGKTMYSDEKNEKSYFFRNLIVKILLVLLFVFLLMWLFPMPNLNPFYDKIFSENISNMTDAAKGYFTVARLPKKEGETKSLTLKEMLDNKMLVEFTDSDGKSCDVNASYVEVTKKGGEYIFKTNLSCSTGQDYVIEYFGCYDVCQNDECKKDDNNTSNETKKVTEYQFYKVTTEEYIDSYICKEGYTLKENKCVLITNIEKTEKAKVNCLTGYTYNDDQNKCIKVDIEKIEPTKKCTSGYTYSSNLDKCVKTDTLSEAAGEKCSDGSTPSNGKCTNVTYFDETESCSNGTTPKNGLCTISSTVNATESCSNGSTPVNGKCTITSTVNATESCSNGSTPVNGKCTITTTENQIVKRKYCASGVDNGTSCTVTSYYTIPDTCVTTPVCSYVGGREVCHDEYSCSGGGTGSSTSYVDYTIEYGCSNGSTPVNGKCTITSTVDSTKSCSNGTTPVNGKCTISTKVNSTKSCSNGTTPSNGKCTITSTVDSIKSCSNGTTPSNGKCKITTLTDSIKYCSNGNTPVNGMCTTISTVTKNYTLHCVYGILEGNECVITTNNYVNPTYSCNSDYTLAGTTCYMTSSKTDILDAEAVYKTKTEKAYKWSTKEKLSGWTRTGKTRTSEVAITSK